MLHVQRHPLNASARPAAEQIWLRAERSLFLKRRWRATADDGLEFGFNLESRLTSGAVIHQTEAADYVVVQQPEPVFQIRCDGAAQAALIGWKLGNLHFPVEIGEGWLRVAPDLAVSQLAAREAWPLTEAVVVFNPLRATPHAS